MNKIPHYSCSFRGPPNAGGMEKGASIYFKDVQGIPGSEEFLSQVSDFFLVVFFF